MNKLHTVDEVDKMKQSSKPAVFLWSASWCPDCLYLNPFLDDIEKNNPELTFYKLDRDELLDEAQKQEILGIPSFTVWKDGRELGRFVSSLRKSPEEIQKFLDTVKEG